MKFLAFALIFVFALSFLTSSFAVTPMTIGNGMNPSVASLGANVYVAWRSSGAWIRVSSNDGASWNPAIKLSVTGQGAPENPILAVTASDVYAIWSAPSSGLYFVVSSNAGNSFSAPLKIAPAGSITPWIAADSNLVSVVYALNGRSEIITSINFGATWTKPFQFSSGPEPQVAVSGSNVYAVADNNARSGVPLAVSHDEGASYKITNLHGGSEPWVVATGTDVYVAWETKTPKSVIWFASSMDLGVTISQRIISTSIPDAWNPMVGAFGSSVWVGIQELGGARQIYMLSSHDGGASFSQLSLLGLAKSTSFVFPQISSTDGTNVFALFLTETGTSWSAYLASSTNAGSTWSTIIQGPASPQSDLAVGSLSSDGSTPLAAWQSSSGIEFA